MAQSDARSTGIRRSQVRYPPGPTLFRENWSWDIFYGHSLPSADSRRAVVRFLAKECTQVLINRLED